LCTERSKGAVKWDSGTKQRFRYGETGEKLEGKIFRVDGDINACNWGLHLQYVDNDIAWSKMPQNMLDYIKELPEFSEAVWKELTKK
jgi:hypothetical protein